MAGNIGIMQGRLSPPVGTAIQAFPLARWKEEFPAARQAGLNQIEWIFDVEDTRNPLSDEAGLAEMKRLSAETGVAIKSLCADYFMSELLLDGTVGEQKARTEKLRWLLGRCAAMGISRVVLPFVDKSALTTPLLKDRLLALAQGLTPLLLQHGIEIHLETSLPPAEFASLLDRIDSPFWKVNYDTGNSASLGYDLTEEFIAYGERVGSIHLKDRLRGGGTVPLGQGDADFAKLTRAVQKINYGGDFVLQVARGKTGAEIEWARQNLAYVRHLLTPS